MDSYPYPTTLKIFKQRKKRQELLHPIKHRLKHEAPHKTSMKAQIKKSNPD